MSSLPYGKKRRKYEEPIWRAWNFSNSLGLYIGRKAYMTTSTSIFQSLYGERGTSHRLYRGPEPMWGRAWNFSKSQDSYIGRKVCTTFLALLSPEAYTGGEARNFFKSQSLYEKSSELFQVPGGWVLEISPNITP